MYRGAPDEAAMRGRPKAELVLTDDERQQLVALTLRRKTAQALAQRARIVLACAKGVDNKDVASRQRVTEGSLGRAVSLLRAALGDRGARPRVLVTVARRGYPFEAEVRESERLPCSRAVTTLTGIG